MPRQSYTIVHMLNSHEPGDLVPSPPPVKQEADLKKLMQNNNNDNEMMSTKWIITKIIDVAVSQDANIDSKCNEKVDNYNDLDLKLARLWHKRTMIIPIIVGSLGCIKNNLEKALKDLGIETD